MLQHSELQQLELTKGPLAAKGHGPAGHLFSQESL